MMDMARINSLVLAGAVGLATVSCGDSAHPQAVIGGSVGGGSSGGSKPACQSAGYAWKGEASNIFRTAQLSAGEWIYTNGLAGCGVLPV